MIATPFKHKSTNTAIELTEVICGEGVASKINIVYREKVYSLLGAIYKAIHSGESNRTTYEQIAMIFSYDFIDYPPFEIFSRLLIEVIYLEYLIKDSVNSGTVEIVLDNFITNMSDIYDDSIVGTINKDTAIEDSTYLILKIANDSRNVVEPR